MENVRAMLWRLPGKPLGLDAVKEKGQYVVRFMIPRGVGRGLGGGNMIDFMST